jgi:tetratricopeptide (TPR) repeat protein
MNVVYYPRFKENVFMRTFSLILFIILFSFSSQTIASADTKLDNLEDYRMKGLEAQEQGLLDDARAYFTKALSLNPDRPDLYNDLGVICERMGNAYEAKRYYFEALNVDKKYLPAYSNLAFLCKREGNLAKAAEYFRKRIELGDPEDPWIKEAVKELRLLGTTFPQEKRWVEEYEASLLRGRAKVLQKKLNEEQDKVSTSHLLKAEKYIQQAKAYEEQGMYAQALAEYDKAIAETPESPRLPEYRRLTLFKFRKSEIEKLVSTALAKLEAGDSVSSKEDFRQILTIIPDE